MEDYVCEDVSDEGLISKIYQELTQHQKTPMQFDLKMSRGLYEPFFQRHTDASRHMKRH